MNTLEFFFDCSSPWTYLAFESLQSLGERHQQLQLIYRPILVGGVFNAVNNSVYEARQHPVPLKHAYAAKDLQDWADYVGIKIGSPPVFPVNSVKAMRGAFVAIEEGLLVPYARRVFERYWTELQDISQQNILQGIVAEVGVDSGMFFDKINTQHYKDLLKQNTEEVVSRGGFGSPTLFLDSTDMYFGNDRLPLLEAKLRAG